MRRHLIRTTRFAWRWTLRAALAVASLALAVALGFTAYALVALPALEPWHAQVLDGEFEADDHADLDFAGYQRLEDALFAHAAAWSAEHAAHPRIGANASRRRARRSGWPAARRTTAATGSA